MSMSEDFNSLSHWISFFLPSFLRYIYQPFLFYLFIYLFIWNNFYLKLVSFFSISFFYYQFCDSHLIINNYGWQSLIWWQGSCFMVDIRNCSYILGRHHYFQFMENSCFSFFVDAIFIEYSSVDFLISIKDLRW